MAIVYNYDYIVRRMKECGLNRERLRKEQVVSQSTMTRLKNNLAIRTDTIDALCNLLHCQPQDIMRVEYDVPDEQVKTQFLRGELPPPAEEASDDTTEFDQLTK